MTENFFSDPIFGVECFDSVSKGALNLLKWLNRSLTNECQLV